MRDLRNITTLLFGGGGSRAIVYIGVLKRLEELEELTSISEVCGVSAGSIFGLLFLLGYTSKELTQIILEKDLGTLVNIKVKDLFREYGLDSGQRVTEFIAELIEAKGYSREITFKQLRALTGKSLRVVTCNINRYLYTVFDPVTEPDLPVLKAIRMSISIPIYFWATSHKGDIHVDGGVIDSYPIRLYQDLSSVLGFKIINQSNSEVNFKVSGLDQFIYYTFYCLMNSKERKVECSTVYIYPHSENITLLNFNLTRETKERLIDIGYNATADLAAEDDLF